MILRKLKNLLPKPLKLFLGRLWLIKLAITPIAKRWCNVCGYEGFFVGFGRPLRLDARCPSCKSLERHRLFSLFMDNSYKALGLVHAPKVIHFAAEPVLEKKFRALFQDYTTADLYEAAELKLNIEQMELNDKSVDIIIANHVLEHVDDMKAIREVERCLRDNGVLICQVPIIEGWETTYENADVDGAVNRELHFGQRDHVRYYGSDFRFRLSSGAMKLVFEYTAEGADLVKYGLCRGEKVFVFQKN